MPDRSVTVLQIILNADEKPIAELQGKTIVSADLSHVIGFPGGMKKGRTSVGLLVHLPDGRIIMAETSLRLFQQASAALTGRYGME